MRPPNQLDRDIEPPSRGGGRMTERLVTVGQCVGALGDEDVMTVRVGEDYLDLTPDEYLAWLRSMGADDRAEWLKAATEAGFADPGVVVDRLCERGLVVVFDDETDIRDVFSRYRLIAQGYGLGADGSEPGSFTVASLDGSPRMRLDLVMYSVWSASWLGSLWDACEAMAEESGRPVDVVARAVAHNLSLVVGCRAGLVDVVA
jgi:hypothetical protein